MLSDLSIFQIFQWIGVGLVGLLGGVAAGKKFSGGASVQNNNGLERRLTLLEQSDKNIDIKMNELIAHCAENRMKCAAQIKEDVARIEKQNALIFEKIDRILMTMATGDLKHLKRD